MLKQIEPQQGAHWQSKRDGGGHSISRTEAARDAGFSDRQQNTAQRIANIPEQEFVEQVEGDSPPTLSQLAAQGVKPRRNLVDLEGRDPSEFNTVMHYVGAFEMVATYLEKWSRIIYPTIARPETGDGEIGDHAYTADAIRNALESAA